MYSVAIDGPSGSGKSTIAKLLADKLNITYVDTGAMYRAIALHSKETGIEPVDFINEVEIDYHDDKVFLNGEDVSDKIRTEEISKLASKISKNLKVREFLVQKQREISKKRSVVMEGRDIGTVVLPEADYKFYLDAGVEVRAKRRYNQLIEKGEKAEFGQVLIDLKDRDFNDMNRENSPLVKAEGAIFIDSADITLEETLDKMLNTIRG
ncbi:cytidylate kinase [Peptoniphilus asaccharolyticus DSM 20463]|uniref:Cytidylate kinase n=1 Tax=Peptoniphilus asaccharolyticus DSM 20463 TaxID=573058 RepID=A0A1W1UNA0_PEPAS|nr:(d)CMP kinase [Peptoniphilus asaccharolyticus]MBL7574954.1 (d)CMP kinase [Peptoniphilus asaccharolyticus]SMB82567.1 cytidylate kinase [Peptoniphilus asaccharolyticus DSM 20463]